MCRSGGDGSFFALFWCVHILLVHVVLVRIVLAHVVLVRVVLAHVALFLLT